MSNYSTPHHSVPNRLVPEHVRETVIALAHQAGKMALAYHGRPIPTRYKSGKRSSPVTVADEAIDHFLRENLSALDPAIGWLSEEQADDGSRLTQERSWIVDPIDGTVSFLEWLMEDRPDNPAVLASRQFAISIALVERGVPVLGVIYAPLCAQTMSASRGQGVWFNGQHISRPQTAATNLTEATFLSSVTERNAGLIAFLEGKLTIRPIHSVAYKMALTGISSNLVMASVKPKSSWDVAAGDCICREAGLTVTDLTGHPLNYAQHHNTHPGLIVAPAALYPALYDLLPRQPTGGYA